MRVFCVSKKTVPSLPVLFGSCSAVTALVIKYHYDFLGIYLMVRGVFPLDAFPGTHYDPANLCGRYRRDLWRYNISYYLVVVGGVVLS